MQTCVDGKFQNRFYICKSQEMQNQYEDTAINTNVLIYNM